ncbi:ribosome biogenesis GTPase YlqF [Phascolarctobacterium faecium]|uniref:ribosome biogenesis GTPase YlqF n=1 Tax=Phascolarctobacterium faecium TaxID=33025 RepID=UPI003FEED634
MDFKIQWFPGHMTKAKRMMEQQLKLVDVVVEMLDARIPRSSSNPMLIQMLGDKPKVVALNKIDMADPEKTEKWLQTFKNSGLPVCKVDCSTGKGVKQMVAAIQQVAKPVTDKWLRKGVRNRSIRVMIVGVPNVGKSTLINRLVGKNKVVAADRPGVTRGQQWVTIAKGLELLDTPGVLWPKFEDPEVGFCLAVTGAIKEDVYDRETAVELLLERLMHIYPEDLRVKYAIDFSEDEPVREVMAKIAVARGCLKAGGVLDIDKVIQLVLRDFRTGRLGRFTLDETSENN